MPRTYGILFSSVTRAAWLAAILLLLLPANLSAQPLRHNVVCREDFSPARREQLAGKLRTITGLPDLKFDSAGLLREGSREAVGGSASARELLANAIHGAKVTVIEDASKRADVAFARVNPGRWKTNAAGNSPVFVVQIDFADFDQLVGDARALQAFNLGWELLHELDHVVADSSDASALGETGECEAHINQMRRECGLPERADYFSTLLPLNRDGSFMTKLVRIAFDRQEAQANKKKRYWVIWDASVVGGLGQNEIALR